MSRKLNVQNLVLAAAMVFGAGTAFVTSPAYAGADAKCDALKVAKAKEACTASKAADVKTFMKDLVKAANANPKKTKKHECADCHKDQKAFELKDGADKEFATLLSDAGK